MLTSEKIPLILASGSPRRLELVNRFWGDCSVEVLIPSFDEAALMPDRHHEKGRVQSPPDSRSLAARLAEGKMDALHSQFDLPTHYVAMTADTLVVQDDQILGKPCDKTDAMRMLNLLSGRTHQVMTGLCVAAVCDGVSYLQHAVEVTEVRFARLRDQQIKWYVDSGEPMDKAGAYAIQGLGAALVKQINGCYYNVMGLPVGRLMDMLRLAADHFSSNSLFSSLLPWN